MKDKDKDQLAHLSRSLGLQFNNLALLRDALRHRSSGLQHNERLEFLGDSILNFTITTTLYQQFPKKREGELTRLRARLVRSETLAGIAKEFNLGDFLELGPGEMRTGGFQRESILADTLEAVIGALFLDQGIESCQQSILSWYQTRLENLTLEPDVMRKDAKTQLQEFAHKRKLSLPEYEVLRIEGGSHNPVFYVECHIPDIDQITQGRANTRRKAEQAAAELLLKCLQEKKTKNGR